ncbi:MAG: hypothetical protein HQK87_08335 [Nitrospinae bacterium]|nr:hypothetical protein [Nitrospinota bacterium]
MPGHATLRATEYLARFLFLLAVVTIVACGEKATESTPTDGGTTPETLPVTFSQTGGGAVTIPSNALFLGVVDAGGINSNDALITRLTSPTGQNWLDDDYLSWVTYRSATVSGGIPYNENLQNLGGVWQIDGSAATEVFWKTAEGARLKVLFVLVSLPVGNDDPALRDIVERFKGIFTRNGMTVADVAYASMQSDDTYMDETDSNGDENLDGMERLFSVSGNFGPYGEYTPIFLVQSIGRGGDTLGIAGGIPGPMKQNTTGSGVVISTFGGDFEGLSDEDRRIMAETMAHELGHYLGLYHTTESDGGTFDPIGDTPECRSGNPTAGRCPDGGNLMFWAAGGSIEQATLTDNQRTVVRRSWYLRP